MLTRKRLIKAGLVTPWIIIAAGVVDRLRPKRKPQGTLEFNFAADAGAIESDATTASRQDDDSIARLAIEVWRLGRRIDQDPTVNDRIRDSFNRLNRALDEAGIETDDPISQPYVEGTRAEIIDVPPNVDLRHEQLFVTDVLRPAVFINGVCVIEPQVILDRQGESEQGRE